MTARLTSRVRAIALMVTALAMGALGSPVASAADPASGALAADAASGATAAAASRYTVKPGQSLNDVAIALTQSHDKAVLARAAKVIFDANPSAFMRGDPSLMKLGAVLNVPALNASGAVAQAPAAASVSASASAASASAVSTPAATGAAAAASTSAPASVPAPAPAPAPAVAVAAASAAALSQAASRPQANAPAPTPSSATVGHAWTGAIQPAASSPAASGAAASTVDQAGTAAPSAPAAAAASGATSAAAPALADRAHTFSSLQQLLALKNRVLMDLQRHGFGSRAGHGTAADHAPSASGASAAAAAPAAQPHNEREGGKPPFAHGTVPGAGERFIGIGGYGVSVPRGSVPVIAAIASAVVVALLVLIGGIALTRRKRRAARAAATERSAGSEGTGSAAAPSAETREASAVPLDVEEDPVAAEFVSILARNPASKRALMGLAARYAERNNARGFDEIAQRIWRLSGGSGPNWLHVAALGRQLDPDNPLYATDEAPGEDVSALPGTPVLEQVPSHSAGAQQALADHEPHAGDAARDEALRLPSGEASAAVDTDTFAHEAEPPASEQPSEPELAANVPAEDVTPTDERAVTEEPATLSEAAEAKAESEPLRTPDTEHPPSQPRFPAEAIAALSELDMGLPPRVESPAVTGSAIEPEPQAEPTELPHQTHQTDETDQTTSTPLYGTAQRETLPHSPVAQREADGLPSDESAPHPSEVKPTAAPSAAPAVAGLGAARFGPLNLAFDLNLSSNGHTPAPAPTALTPPAMFTAEEMATIARNKLELAVEYVALGDVGGARTLIHEVIESNDSGTREQAHALLATLAPLS